MARCLDAVEPSSVPCYYHRLTHPGSGGGSNPVRGWNHVRAATVREITAEMRGRAVRMVFDHQDEYGLGAHATAPSAATAASTASRPLFR